MNKFIEQDVGTEHLEEFQPVSDYRRPAMPAEEVVWRFYDRVKRTILLILIIVFLVRRV